MIAHTPRAKNLALVLLAMTQFVIVIDASIVNVALPSIGAHFAVAGAILAAVLISSRDSREHSNAARSSEAGGADAAAVPVVAG